MQENYNFLLSVYETILDTLRDGGLTIIVRMSEWTQSTMLNGVWSVGMFLGRCEIWVWGWGYWGVCDVWSDACPGAGVQCGCGYVWCVVCVCPGAGVKLCDVYNVASEKVETERPQLKDHFTRNAGLTEHTPPHYFTLSCTCTCTCRLPF